MYPVNLSGYRPILTLETQEACDGSMRTCPLAAAIAKLKQANVLPETNVNGEYIITHANNARQHTLHVRECLADAAVSHLKPATQGAQAQ